MPETGADGKPPRGVVLVTVDSLRADALGAGVAPTLEGLADRGVSFRNAFAHGNWTPFSFPAVLGTDHVFADDGSIGVGTETLAERLSAAGVATAGFNAANGFLTSHWGYDRGFDRYRSYLGDGSVLTSRYVMAHPTVRAWLQALGTSVRGLVGRLRGTDSAPIENASKLRDVERGAQSFLRTVDRPFFCWVHYMDLHTPYLPAPRHVRAVSGDRTGITRLLRSQINAGLGRQVTDGALASLRTLYHAALRGVDESVARLLDTLSTRGLRERTCVVVAGDHGEEFQDHGHLAHYPKLYDELVRVPLVVDAPGEPGRRIDAPVGLDTVPPTVCDWLGVGTTGFAGESLLPALRGIAPSRAPVISVAVRGESVTDQPIPRSRSAGDLLVSARTDRFTYIYNAGTGHRELYDRRVDPGETTDRSGRPEAEPTVRRLHRAVESYLAGLGSESGSGSGEHAPPDEAVERRLGALGYR
ncbi:MAG: sulfatase [Salinirussus sp.]